MYRRVLTALLIVVAMVTESVAYVRVQEPETGAYQEKLTAEEERDAIQVARQFVEGFEELNNLPALIDKLYVKEFDARLRSKLNEYSYVVSVEPEVTESASREDLRRFYAAALGFYYIGMFIYGLEEYKRRQAGEPPGGPEPGIHDLLPPSVIDVLRSDPILVQVVTEAEEEERRRNSSRSGEASQGAGSRQEEEPEARGNAIRSLDELRHYISTLEKANALTRAYLKTLPGPRTWDEMIRAVSQREEKTESSGNDVCTYMCPSLYILPEDSPGLKKGMRLILIKVLAFDMVLIRADGKLKIFNLSVVD
jgi:hypothetical protein